MTTPRNDKTVIDKSNRFGRAVMAAVGVGLAFGAGLVVGGVGKARAADIELPADPVARADARTARLVDVKKTLQLSFYTELQAPEAKQPPLPALVPASKSGGHDAHGDAPAPDAAGGHDDNEGDSAPVVDKAPVAEPVVEAPRVVVDAAAEARTQDGDEGDVDVKKADPERVHAALQKVLGAPADKPAATGAYAIQIASTPDEAGARSIASKASAQGFSAVVVAADLAGKGRVYRVRVPGFATRASADQARQRLGQGIVVAE